MNHLLFSLMMAAISCVVFLVIIVAMAVGVLFGRRSIQGSCGGLNNGSDADRETSCGLCSNPSQACRQLADRMNSDSKSES